jgi:hypothetical protein
MRNFAKSGESLPDGFMCPGGWQVLVDYYQSLAANEQKQDAEKPAEANNAVWPGAPVAV